MSNYDSFLKEDDTLKITDIFENSIVIKDEKVHGKIIIDLSSIIEINPVKGNENKISLIYHSNGMKKTTTPYCEDRGNILSRIYTMKDRASKFISEYSIETFKCYNLMNIDEQLLKKIGEQLSQNNKDKMKTNSLNSENTLNKYIAFYTLYRTYSVINQITNKELKTYYIKLVKIIRIEVAKNIYGLITEDINKIRIVIIPINQNDVLTIKNLIISYSKKYLFYEIKYEEANDYLKEISSIDLSLSKVKSDYIYDKRNFDSQNREGIYPTDLLKVQSKDSNGQIKKLSSHFVGKLGEINKEMKLQEYLFTYYNVNRILYNKNIRKMTLKCSYEYINLYTNNIENDRIKLSDIFIISVKGEEDKYFEIILNNKSRFIFEVEEKNRILNDIIELLLKYYRINKLEQKFLIFSYKIGIEKYFKLNEDSSSRNNYEERKIEEILNKERDLREIIEDIVINQYFISGSKNINKLLTEPIIKILLEKFDDCYNKCINNNNDIKNNIILLNLFMIFFKNLGINLLLDNNGKKICDNIFEKLTKELEDKYINKKTKNNIIFNDYALFYNAIHIIENFSLYKQIMLLRVLSFNRKVKITTFNYDSMYINYLLILFENKLFEMKEIPDIFLPESTFFYLLLALYSILLYEHIYVLRNVISVLSRIIEKLNEKKREFKEILLKKTVIFYVAIKKYLINNNFDIIFSKNCLKLFQVLLNQYYEISIPIKNIFPPTLIKQLGGKKDPDKWDNNECEKFFVDILKDYHDEKIIWNKDCKNELIEALKKFIGEYENSIENKLKDLNNPPYKVIKENNFKDILRIIFNSDTYGNLEFYPKNRIERPLFCIDYLNFKVNYKALNKEVYILDTYINILFNNKKEKDIDKPKKYWKKLKKEIVLCSDDKRLIIINAMKLLYKKYYEIIGNFDEYYILNKISKLTKNKILQEEIKDLFYISIKINDLDIKKNNVRDIIKADINYINVN